MSGNTLQGKKAAETNKARHGADFYAKIGAKGGKKKPTKPRGFAAMSKKKLLEISAKGGANSRKRRV